MAKSLIFILCLVLYVGLGESNGQCPEVADVSPAPVVECGDSDGTITFIGQFDITYWLLLNNTGSRIGTTTSSGQTVNFNDLPSGNYYLYGEAQYVCSRFITSVTLTVPTHSLANVALTPSSEPSLVCDSTAFTLTASGAPSGKPYKWKYKGDVNNGSWGNLSGASGSSYTSANIAAGLYKVAVENECENDPDSESDLIEVKKVARVGVPTITSGATTRCLEAGSSTYSANATDANSFTWTIMGGVSMMAGTTTKPGDGYSHNIGTAHFNGTDTSIKISVRASGCGGSSRTSSQLTVSTSSIAPKISTPSVNQVCAGIPVDFTVNSPDIDVTYKLINASGGVEKSKTATNTSSFTLQAPGPGTYTVQATNMYCASNKMVTNAQTIGLKSPGTVSVQRSNNSGNVTSNSLCIGDGFKFTASNGNTYRWYWTPESPNGHNPEDPVSLSAMYPNSEDLETGTYKLKAKENVCNTEVDIDPFFVIQHPLPDASILEPTVPSTKISSTGNQLVRTVAQVDHTYQWYVAGNAITGGTGVSYSASLKGTYKVKVTSPAGCSKVSDNFFLDVNAPAVINIGNPQTITLPVSRTNLIASFTDGDGSVVSNSWAQTSGKILSMSANSGDTITLTNLSVGTFQFKISAIDNFGEQTIKIVDFIAVAPSNNHNYVRQEAVQVEGIKTTDGLMPLNASQKFDSWTYLDGLGRPVQKIAVKSSPGQLDVVTPIVYDSLGRESRQYLPITLNGSGAFNPSLLNVTGSYVSNFYSNSADNIADGIPYSETVFEKSPLDRVLIQGAPGADWQPSTSHTVRKQYLTNGDNDVLLFVYDGSSQTILSTYVYYEANTLTCTKTIDEQQNDVLEYVDKEGHMICKKVKAPNGVYASTYYVYDDFGNLVVVIPPEGVRYILNPTGN